MKDSVMKRSMKRAIAVIASAILVVGIAGMPSEVKAEEADGHYYPVDLTDGQEHEVDPRQIENEYYECGVRLSLDAPIDKIRFCSSINGGLVRMTQVDQAESSATVDIYVDVYIWSYPDHIGNINWVKIKREDDVLIVSTDYKVGNDKVLVLDEGQSVTITKEDIPEAGDLLLAHTGVPTQRETVSQMKIKKDGSIDESYSHQWDAEEYWVNGTHDPEEWYIPPRVNPEPFREEKHSDATPGVDNWWGEDEPATCVTISYTDKEGYKLVYDWRKPEPTITMTDVSESAYYYEPVIWATGRKITSGVSDGKFAPNDKCTRAQVVTFLWRAYGSPEPASMTSTFADVQDTNAYYYKPVLWAAEKGITSGTEDGKFNPNATVTRGQFVTLLWRAEGKPSYTSSNPFSDLSANGFYYDAVLWAVEKEVTAGTSTTTFSPNMPCTRGQVVTFLYRDLK